MLDDVEFILRGCGKAEISSIGFMHAHGGRKADMRKPYAAKSGMRNLSAPGLDSNV